MKNRKRRLARVKVEPPAPRCIVRDDETRKRCPRPVYVQKYKLCVGHYKRLRATGDTGGLLRRRQSLSELYPKQAVFA